MPEGTRTSRLKPAREVVYPLHHHLKVVASNGKLHHRLKVVASNGKLRDRLKVVASGKADGCSFQDNVTIGLRTRFVLVSETPVDFQHGKR